MKLVDANVLIYAVNTSDPKHEQSRSWLDDALNGQEVVAVTWVVLLAFLRLTTRIGLLPNPLPVADALATMQLVYQIYWADRACREAYGIAPPEGASAPMAQHP